MSVKGNLIFPTSRGRCPFPVLSGWQHPLYHKVFNFTVGKKENTTFCLKKNLWICQIFVRQQNLQSVWNVAGLWLLCGCDFLCLLVLSFICFGRTPQWVFWCDIYSFPHANWPSSSPGTADHELIRAGRESVQGGQLGGCDFSSLQKGSWISGCGRMLWRADAELFVFCFSCPFFQLNQTGILGPHCLVSSLEAFFFLSDAI